MRPFRESGILALDLVNTVDPYLAEPERLPDLRALRGFLGEYGLDARVSRHDLDRCKAVRGKLFQVLSAPTASEMVERLNAVVAEVTEGAALVARAGGGWSLTLAPRRRRRLDEQLEAIAVGELVDLMSTVGPERIRACRATPCREIFVDTSRNGRRLYCSRRCANRVNAARYRNRREPDPPPERSERHVRSY